MSTRPTQRPLFRILAGATLAVAAAAGTLHATDVPAEPDGLAVNRLGAELHATLAADDDNLVFSPFSVAVALAMTSAGADGATLAEINAVLGLAGDDPHPAVAALVDGIVERSDGALTVANSLWTRPGFDVERKFGETLTGGYGAEARQTDFGDPDAAVEEINAWVADVTAGRIPALLSPDAIGEVLTRLVLVNAILLDAEWRGTFEPESTRPRPFVTSAGAEVEVDFMHQVLEASYADGADAQAVQLPYTNGLEMVVVLPAEGELATFESALVDAGGDLDAIVGEWRRPEVDLSLPKWDIETAADLADPLAGLGMPSASDERAADFSRITTEEDLFVSAVVHQANITVDEEGTEAAAATAVVMEPTSAPIEAEPELVTMTVDRPFFFAVRDAATGIVIFQGRVTDPR